MSEVSAMSKDDVKVYLEKFIAAAKFASHFMPAKAKAAIEVLEQLASQEWFIDALASLLSLGSVQAIEDKLKSWVGAS
jgi:hypothetical protein